MPDIFVATKGRGPKEYSSVMAEHRQTKNPLAAFVVRPKSLTFVTQEAQEKVLLMLTMMWYLLTVGLMLEKFLSWYFNVYIVTDERIVDIDFYSLIYKEISDTKIERIQDVTVVQGGVIRALFNFGTVNIQTAGERREFDFEDVPKPQVVAKFLNEMMLEEEKER